MGFLSPLVDKRPGEQRSVGGFFGNLVGGVGDVVTGLAQLVGTGAADVVGEAGDLFTAGNTYGSTIDDVLKSLPGAIGTDYKARYGSGLDALLDALYEQPASFLFDALDVAGAAKLGSTLGRAAAGVAPEVAARSRQALGNEAGMTRFIFDQEGAGGSARPDNVPGDDVPVASVNPNLSYEQRRAQERSAALARTNELIGQTMRTTDEVEAEAAARRIEETYGGYVDDPTMHEWGAHPGEGEMFSLRRSGSYGPNQMPREPYEVEGFPGVMGHHDVPNSPTTHLQPMMTLKSDSDYVSVRGDPYDPDRPITPIRPVFDEVLGALRAQVAEGRARPASSGLSLDDLRNVTTSQQSRRYAEMTDADLIQTYIRNAEQRESRLLERLRKALGERGYVPEGGQVRRAIDGEVVQTLSRTRRGRIPSTPERRLTELESLDELLTPEAAAPGLSPTELREYLLHTPRNQLEATIANPQLDWGPRHEAAIAEADSILDYLRNLGELGNTTPQQMASIAGALAAAGLTAYGLSQMDSNELRGLLSLAAAGGLGAISGKSLARQFGRGADEVGDLADVNGPNLMDGVARSQAELIARKNEELARAAMEEPPVGDEFIEEVPPEVDLELDAQAREQGQFEDVVGGSFGLQEQMRDIEANQLRDEQLLGDDELNTRLDEALRVGDQATVNRIRLEQERRTALSGEPAMGFESYEPHQLLPPSTAMSVEEAYARYGIRGLEQEVDALSDAIDKSHLFGYDDAQVEAWIARHEEVLEFMETQHPEMFEGQLASEPPLVDPQADYIRQLEDYYAQLQTRYDELQYDPNATIEEAQTVSDEMTAIERELEEAMMGAGMEAPPVEAPPATRPFVMEGVFGGGNQQAVQPVGAQVQAPQWAQGMYESPEFVTLVQQLVAQGYPEQTAWQIAEQQLWMQGVGRIPPQQVDFPAEPGLDQLIQQPQVFTPGQAIGPVSDTGQMAPDLRGRFQETPEGVQGLNDLLQLLITQFKYRGLGG